MLVHIIVKEDATHYKKLLLNKKRKRKEIYKRKVIEIEYESSPFPKRRHKS